MIRAKYGLPAGWVSDRDIGQLVEQADGVFVYATMAIRFIDGNAQAAEFPGHGPRERLQALLATPEGPRSQLSKLDRLYLLIMDQIPKDILPATLLFLAGYHFVYAPETLPTIHTLRFILDLSETTLNSLLHSALHPVVDVVVPNPKQEPCLRFNHTSFTDFLTTLDRATPEYCIKTSGLCNRLSSACVDATIRGRPLVHQSMYYLHHVRSVGV
jgi:hypothetical protein